MNIKELIKKEKFSEANFIEYIKSTFDAKVEIEDTKSNIKHQYIKQYTRIAEKNITKFKKIGFFIVESSTQNIEKTRVGFNQFIGKLISGGNYAYRGLIVAIHHPQSNVWRLSYVALELDNNRELSTRPKRYTFELGKDIPTKTAEIQLEQLNKTSTLEDIKEAFSVEKLSNDFFKEYKKLYLELVNNVYAVNNDKLSSKAIENKKAIASYIKKMLGRIVFLYFVQKKGWLNNEKKFLSNLFDKCITDNKSIDFYDEVMEVLFFKALNDERKNPLIKLGNNEYNIPYLNGGLFEEDEYDSLDISISNEHIKKVFDLFDSYNFTIIEDTPHDSEVAIDPEMLGRVFEDLLEDRKDKGAYYTPREIVHYMCQQSIINYLSNSFEDIRNIKELVINHNSDNEFVQANSYKIQTLLENIKILDPAIGSGAFPMGMLHEIVQILHSLDTTKDISILKREIIKNSIYGIDIEPSAVEIAKLRFWLSIVVDEDEATPLPNLFYKIMVGNSLVETLEGIDPLQERKKGSKAEKERVEIINSLNNLISDYYKEHKNKNQLKIKITKMFSKLFKEISREYPLQQDSLITGTTKKDIQARELGKIIDELKTKHFSSGIFLYKLFFNDVLESGGFDVVIGNPPYLRVQGIDSKLSEKYKQTFNSATGKYDLYVLFTEKSLELISKQGIVNFIMPHKWINASFGKGLRNISKDKISKFISFGAYQVFNASTYTSLVWFENNKKNETLNYIELDKDLITNQELEKYLTTLNNNSYTKIKNKNLTAENWIFTNKKIYEILEKINKQFFRIKDVFEYVSTGIVSNGDDCFYLKGEIKNKYFIGFSKALNKEVKLEKDLLKPLLIGTDIKRYSTITNEYFVIYPHFLDNNNKTKPYEENIFRNKFPLTYKYLVNFKNELIEKKVKYRNNIQYWYSLNRARQISMFCQEKILTPEISYGCNMTIDTNNFYTNTQNYCLIKKKIFKESHKFYLSILNSKLLWFYLKNTGIILGGGYFRFKTNYLNPFPIPKIDDIKDTEPFEILVDEIMSIKQDLKENIDLYTPLEKTKKIKKFKDLEDKIDKMVYKLYGLNDDEINIIEENIKNAN